MAAVATLHDVDPMDGEAVADLAERLGVGLVVVGPEAPLVAGVADAVTARGIAGLRADRRGRAARGLEGVRQGRDGRGRRADRARASCAPTPDEVDRPRSTSSGRRTSSRTTASPPARASWSPRTGPRRARTRLACERVVIEEFLDGPEVSLFGCQLRRATAHRLPAAAGPGLQADLRRRRGPQHRRHGRLHPAAVGAGRPGRRGAARPCSSRPSTRWRGAAPPSPACCTPAWR